LVQRFLPVDGLTGHFYIGDVRQNLAQTLAHNRVIIGNEYFDHNGS
jgi:hypothetical protein